MNNQNSDTIKWTIAVYAPILLLKNSPFPFVGGVSKENLSHDFVESKLNYFKDEWGIINKETANHCLLYLYNGGINFDSYKTKLGELFSEIDDNHNQDDKDAGIRKNILKKSARIYVKEKYPEIGIIGCDLAKGMYIVSQLYLVSIYSYEETMSITIKMAEKLQKCFNNWDDAMENVFLGLQCEFGMNPYDSNSYITQRRKYYYKQKKQKDGFYSIDWNTTLENNWQVPNVLSYPDTIKWFNTAKALLQASNPWTPKLFPMGLMPPSYAKTKLKMLESSWNINNREDAQKTIQKLLEGKMHNERFLEEWQYIKGMTFAEYIENTAEIDEESILDSETIKSYKRYYNLFHTIIGKYGDKGIIAWDLYRAMYLISVSYGGGLYTYEEALNTALIVSKKIQENFDSWDDYMNNYFLGYQYWSRDILENPLENLPLPKDEILNFNEADTTLFRKKLYQWLKNEEDSVYDIPWNTVLKKEW